MSALETHVATLLADPLGDARGAARGGRRIIGYIGPDVPVELILAAEVVPVRLSGRLEPSTPNADRILERAFTPEIRSIAEQWLSGALDFMETVILPRSDDSAQRLYYYICELQRQGQCRGPRPVIYDVAGVERESSRRHTLEATARLAREIGAAPERVADAARKVAERDALLWRMTSLRLEEMPPPGSLIHRIARASSFAWTEAFNAELQGWISAGAGSPALAENAHSARLRGARRLLLAGSAPPDERLHLAVESSAATVVRELTDAKLLPLMPERSHEPASSARPESAAPAGSLEVPIASIAAQYHSQVSVAQAFLKSPDMLVAEARACRADGVIIWMIEENETLVWELPGQVRALTTAGVPVLTLTRQTWAAGPEVLETVADFAGTLRARS